MRATLLLALALTGCATDTTDVTDATTVAGGNVEQRIIATGSNAAVEPDAPKTVTISKAEEYRSIWESTIGGGQPPEVDFSKESVVILLAGQRRTGGYSVVPRGVSLDGRTLVVDAAINKPPADAIVTQALTSPYAVIAVNTKNFDNVRWNP